MGLNRYQRHLNKLVARRGQYANWWKQQQAKKKVDNEREAVMRSNGVPEAEIQANKQYQHDTAMRNDQGVSANLRHTNSLQQLEHYNTYYNKQLEKMQASAEKDFKFHTYVEYYRQKLKAVERRQKELEARIANDKPMPTPESGVENNTILKLISNDDKVDETTTTTNSKKDDADDPFAELLDLGGLGYTAAAKPAAASEKK